MGFSAEFEKKQVNNHVPEHIGVICQSKEELEQSIVDLICASAARNEECLYISKENGPPNFMRRLKKTTDYESLSSQYGPIIFPGDDLCSSDGSFDLGYLTGVIKKTAEEAASDGFKGLNILRAVSWLPYNDLDCTKTADFELSLIEAVPEFEITSLCFYNIDEFEPRHIIEAIRRHPEIMYQGNLHDNIYYIPDSSHLNGQGNHFIKKMLVNIAAADGKQNGTKNGANLSDFESRILERRLAEYEKNLGVFKESESYFRNLVNAAPVAIVMTDKGGKCLFVNDYWRQLSGLSLQESIGSGWQKVVHREDIGRMGVWWYGRRKKNYGPGTLCRINTAGGKVKRVELKSSPLYDDNGSMFGYIAMFSEIDEHIISENEDNTGQSSRHDKTAITESINNNIHLP